MPNQGVDIHVDSKAVLKDFDRIGRSLREKVIRNSVNEALRFTRVLATRKVREELTLPARDVRAALSARRAYRGGFSAALIVHARRVPLIKYKARMTRRGVTLKVKKRGPRKRIGYAFIATMDSGHTGVFARDLDKPQRRGAKRTSVQSRKSYRPGLPIKELSGSEVIDVLDDPRVLNDLVSRGGRRLQEELRRRLDAETQ